MSFVSLLFWLQLHKLSSNWRQVSIVTRIIKRAYIILEIDIFSLENNFIKSMRVKIELVLSKPLILGVKIPFPVGNS